MRPPNVGTRSAASSLGRAPGQVAFVRDSLGGATGMLSVAFGLGRWDQWVYTPSYPPRGVHGGQPGSLVFRVVGCRLEAHVEIIKSVQMPSIFLEHLERHGFGLRHLGYVVESRDAVRRPTGTGGPGEVQPESRGRSRDGWRWRRRVCLLRAAGPGLAVRRDRSTSETPSYAACHSVVGRSWAMTAAVGSKG